MTDPLRRSYRQESPALRGFPWGVNAGCGSNHIRLAERLRLIFGRTDRDAAAEHVLVAVHVVHARHRRPVFLLAQGGQRERRQLARVGRSEEHTSELQSLMRISYAVFY